MKATRRPGLREATKADFVEDLRNTVVELVDHRRTDPARVRQIVTEAISTTRAYARRPGLFSSESPAEDSPGLRSPE
jgi:hypothetical protein